MLTFLATAYGVGAAGAALFQTRQLLESRRSCEVSARFFAVYAGGYAIWLAYGASIGSMPLIIVDAIGVVCATAKSGFRPPGDLAQVLAVRLADIGIVGCRGLLVREVLQGAVQFRNGPVARLLPLAGEAVGGVR